MIVMALIPIVGVFLLTLLCAVVLNRRAARIALADTKLQSRAADILNRDAENDQNLVDSILRGTATDQAIAQHVKVRGQLLAGVNPNEPANWTAEQFESWKRDEFERAVAEANRRLTVPSVAGALFIVTASIVTVAVLYNAHSPVQDATSPLSKSPPTVEKEHVNPQLPQGLHDLAFPPLAMPASTDVDKSRPSSGVPDSASPSPNHSSNNGQESK